MALQRAEKTAVSDHGGSLDAARALFADAPQPWVDLSTGINPHAYPLFDLPATAFSRLPEPGRIAELGAVAAGAYRAGPDVAVVPAPGTQALLPLVMRQVPPGRARVLGPTYAEHARCARLAGHAVEEVSSVGALFDADLAVIVNPNNPDGRSVARETLLALAGHMRAKGGLLVVDEAFMDVGPAEHSLAGGCGAGGVVVLRSFGKFFGLAGIRLGFALGAPDLVAGLAARLGPWAVSGPALEIGLRALEDRAWQTRMRARLRAERARLDALLAAAGIEPSGGTPLFAFVRDPAAPDLFAWLGASGLYIRRFAERPDCLRIGLPGDDAWPRLEAALAAWSARNQPAGPAKEAK
ncbi:MAG: threonine-phosphate decarboxylase CobD [Nitratireductor sp.]